MMRLFFLVVAALLVPSHVTCLMSKEVKCATPELSKEELEKEALLEKEFVSSRYDAAKSQSILYIIDVYWHAVVNGDEITTDEMINDSIDTLNRAMKPHFEFNLKEIMRYSNEQYWNLLKDGTEEKNLKINREGDCTDLNVYTTNLGDRSIIGWASLPVKCDFSDELANDGVVIQYNTLVGGNYEPYNEGFTLVHEVGHWLNLLHPFQGGCNGSDAVDDTPQVASPNYGCPVGVVDSCPDDPGADLIGNFMDYFDDTCMDSFTDGQFARMKISYDVYRCGGPSGPSKCVEYTPRPTSTSLPPSTPPSKVASTNPTAVASTEPSVSPTTSRSPSDLPTNPPSETPQCVWKKRVPCVSDECAWNSKKGCSECEVQPDRRTCIKYGCVWDFRGPNKNGVCTTCKSLSGQKKKCQKFNCIYKKDTKECSSCLTLSKSNTDCKKAKCAYIRSKQTCSPCGYITTKKKCKNPCHWQGGKYKGKCSPPCSTFKKEETCKEPCSWDNGKCVM